MQLLDDLKWVLLVKDGDDRAVFASDELDDILLRARILDENVTKGQLQASAFSSTDTPYTFHDNKQVSIELNQLFDPDEDDEADWTEYGFSPIVDLHSHRFKVYVDDVEVDETTGDTTNWTYNARAMVLSFTEPQTEDAEVKIRGWLVDTRAAKYEALTRFISKLAIPGNVRGQEFEQHAKRALMIRDAIYGGQQLRLGR